MLYNEYDPAFLSLSAELSYQNMVGRPTTSRDSSLPIAFGEKFDSSATLDERFSFGPFDLPGILQSDDWNPFSFDAGDGVSTANK